MTNTKIKTGDAIMKRAAEQLIAEGYIVEKAKKIRWMQQDFFGCWDLMAIKKGCLRFIQVSAKKLSNRGVEYQAKLNDFPVICHHVHKEFWYWEKMTPDPKDHRGEFRIKI